METPIRFTREAFSMMTLGQKSAIKRLAENKTVDILVDFSLPEGYLAFKDGFVYGGISPEGEVST